MVISRQSSVVGSASTGVPETLAVPAGFRDLEVYKRSFEALRPLHELVLRFPDYEKWDLAQQMRRAAKSIPANIGEGYALRDAPKLFCKHLRIAYGSAAEIRVHFDVALELGYISPEEHERFKDAYTVIAKQLYRLWHYWRKRLAIQDEDS